MKLLCVDTTKQKAIIALNNDGKMLYREIPETKRHSEALLTELEQFLTDNRLTIKDITNLGCVTGPGSFTGIRIGMATVKAFSFALNLPIVSANCFEVIAEGYKNGYVALKNTATAVYLAKITDGVVGEILVVNNEDLIPTINNEPLFVSDCEQITGIESYKNINVIEDYNSVMLKHFVRLVETESYTNGNNFAPTYAQLSQAERNLKD